ncbi:tyrosine-type recombinase/integrase [Mesorhizobium carmichaelinearum]|uniref:tyrosine-type recombinase/integrase n=1 Tax=Mesorhizobium carmichaelinearum TaxID=1208188 RepID=UPI00313B2085
MNANEYLQRSKLYRKLIHGPYGEFSRVYAARLSDEGFAQQCTRRSLSLFRDLMDWHVGNGHDPRDLGEAHVEQYLEHRSKHWSINAGDRAALRRLLSALRDEGLVPAAPPIEPTEQEQIVEAFAAYLTSERGLALTTVERHKPLAYRFLQETCPAGADGFAALTPEIVIGYVERHALDGSADSGKAMCGVVRAFMRYLHVKGFIAVALANCVPSIRRWRLAGLPTFLPPEKVQQVLDACDRATAMGLRDYAVLMVLAKLGLRAGEVAALIQRVLAIPSKRSDKRQLQFLTRPEIEAILACPDRSIWLGRRDHTLLLLAVQTGLRVSEIVDLDRDSVMLGRGAHVRCIGKGRKERSTPLTKVAQQALQCCSRNQGSVAQRPYFRTCTAASSVPTACRRC